MGKYSRARFSRSFYYFDKLVVWLRLRNEPTAFENERNTFYSPECNFSEVVTFSE